MDISLGLSPIQPGVAIGDAKPTQGAEKSKI